MTRRTSIYAYREIEENGLLSKRRFQVYSTLYRIGPATAAEIATAIPGEKSSSVGFNVHARLCELKRMGCVDELGERSCNITGNNVILWDVNESLPRKLETKTTETRKQLEKRCNIYLDVLTEISDAIETPNSILKIIHRHIPSLSE